MPISIFAFLFFIACNGESVSDDPPSDTDTDTDADPDCVEDSDCSGWEICEDEICIEGDRDNTFEDATAIFQDQEQDGYINVDGDVDYYKYQATGKEWVRIGTVTDERENGLDTIVTVYKPNGSILLSMDEFPTGEISTYDTLFHAYLEEAGEWIIAVEDKNGQGGSSFTYSLEVSDWSSSTTSESDTPTDPSITVDIAGGSTIYGVGVVFEESGDTDYIAVNTPFTDQPLQVYSIEELPGSEATPRVQLYEGETLLSDKANVGPDGSMNYLFATNSSYTLAVSDTAGAGGAGHWGVVYIRTRPEDATRNQLELEVNDTLESATLVEQEAVNECGEDYERGYIRGQLESEGDEDWFSMTGFTGGTLNVYCGSESYGSLGDLALDIHNPDGSLLTTITESDDSTPDGEDIETLDAGVYSLRFYSEDAVYSPGVYYRCGLFMYK